MAITQDGTHRFGIANSPLTINSVTYIAESVSYDQPTTRVQIADDEGIPTGAVIIPQEKRISGTLQLANASTAIPAIGGTITFEGSNYYLETVTRDETQAQYAKLNFTAVEKIN